MADENQGPGLFDVPEEPLYIRTPRTKLLGTAIGFLVLIVAVAAVSSIPIGGMPLMLIFVAPLWIILIYCVLMYSKVWAAYKYSRLLLIGTYLVAVVITYLITFTVFFTT